MIWNEKENAQGFTGNGYMQIIKLVSGIIFYIAAPSLTGDLDDAYDFVITQRFRKYFLKITSTHQCIVFRM